MVLSSLQWECLLAEPETVKGLLADNIGHPATSNQALQTQKKQYLLKGRTSDNEKSESNDQASKIKTPKIHEIQAQKHQKLLNAIEENAFPRLISSSNNERPPQSAIRNLLTETNNRIKNELASDLAARNINFLNERARPPQNQRTTGTINSMNENGIASHEKPKGYPNLHPATIGRISYRGKA